MEYRKKYQQWLEFPGMDEELSQELTKISLDENEIANRFSKEIAFGTGGIRGRMGAGTALINIYIVRKVTAGLARYLLNSCPQVGKAPSVVIACDTRRNSERFVRETAEVLSSIGIKAWVFPEPTPTPLLSFAVRELQASAGVVITASHNPPADNGYKVYGSDGGQITDCQAQAITEQILQVENELTIPGGDLEEAKNNGLLELVGAEVDNLYFKHLQSISLSSSWWGKGSLPVRVVYTPLHGTGGKAIPRALANAGITDLFLVSEQLELDPNCSTVQYPNPEDWEVYNLAIALGKEKEADLLLATDLDADRLGAAVRSISGRYVPLTGNQIGCLLLDYILSQRKKQGKLPANGIVIQTVVTSEMGKAIAADYGVETVETLTGFKYIGEQIKERVDTGQNVFLFGFEESYGYLAGDFVRDKDGIQASQLVAEMTAYYKYRKMTLLDALEQLFFAHGYFQEELVNLKLAEGELYRVEQGMNQLRGTHLLEMNGLKIIRADDYLKQLSTDVQGNQTPIGLPASNALKYILEDLSWFCIRPSGTEPKIKIYLGVKEDSADKATAKLSALKEKVLALVTGLEMRSL
ncbi:MAG: phospho-sugar mutase [Dethiobacter sp.]|nr:phospho-sugar mutase [Dethiobacter sp.]